MENVKIPFTHRRAVKAVCWCLSVICILMAVIGVFTAVLAVDDNWFSYRPNDFYSSNFVASRMDQHNWRIATTLVEMKNSGETVKLGPEDGFVNVFYEVVDENGEPMADNLNYSDGANLVHISDIRCRDYWYGKEVNYTIKYYLRSNLRYGDGYREAKAVYDWLKANCIAVFVLAGLSCLLLLACVVVLLCGAGHKQGVEGYALSAFNRKFPLDLHAACCVALCVFALFLFIDGTEELLYTDGWVFFALAVVLAVLSALAFIVVVMHFLVCLAARVKGGKWWRCSIIYYVLSFCWRALKKIYGRFAVVFRSLPLIWRSVLIFCGASLVDIILTLAARDSFFGFLCLMAFNAALLLGVAYLAISLRRLQKGGVALAEGDLSYKVDTTGMCWDFKQHAENLNSISEGMNRAVEERMKSERFKTELITNVSHDIKTPLTSIINYVDLLKKQPPGGEETAEYLEVLERQSMRLKKLTEDLVEASKASSGALNVELAPTDVCELLRQAAGEYDHRIRAAQLQTVITTPDQKVDIICDGRLLWRVFDNLLGNICKYSQPGTRAYLSIDEDEERAWIMCKNISREVLNIKAEELMERFVRGDSSRSTEGSGLGLSIARSLTELQGGTFRLFIDGDLFKVIITFPKSAIS